MMRKEEGNVFMIIYTECYIEFIKNVRLFIRRAKFGEADRFIFERYKNVQFTT